jgi:hypothetical protein
MIRVRAPDGWICVVAQDGDVFLPVQWRDALDRTHTDAPSPGLREHPFSSPEAAMDAAYRERLSRDCPRRLRQEITDNLATLAATFRAKRA